MHSNYPCALWYILECSCYCTFFKVQYFVIAIVIRTCLTVFFLGGCSKNYIITSCVSSCFICYFDCRSAYFDICDNRSIWCDCCYREWISIRPFAKYFLTIFITFPSVAVCIVNTFIYIFECSRSLYLVFADRCIVLICDAVTICRNYIIISTSSERTTVALLPTTLTSEITGAPTVATSTSCTLEPV